MATRVFGEKGWAATGMRDVARERGGRGKVYANFRSKSELVTACIDQATVGDPNGVPLDQRPEFVAMGVGTREARVRAAAWLIAGTNQRTAGVLLALREAAASDPELARWRRAGRVEVIVVPSR